MPCCGGAGLRRLPGRGRLPGPCADRGAGVRRHAGSEARRRREAGGQEAGGQEEIAAGQEGVIANELTISRNY